MKRSSWRRVGLACGSLLVSLAIAEVVARSLYPPLRPSTPAGVPERNVCGSMVDFDAHTGWWTKPDLDCVAPAERSVPIRTNSLGLRADREFGPKLPWATRIGVFGDSFTFGALVTADEIYASVLEHLLPDVEVVNFGLSGGGPDQSLLVLRHKAAALQLDVVLVAPSVENIERILMTERDGRAKPYFTLESGRLQLHNYPVPVPGPSRGVDAPGVTGAVVGDSSLARMTLDAMRPVTLRLGVYRPYAALYAGSAGGLLERILQAFREEAGAARLVFAPLPTYHYIEYGLAPDYEAVFRRAAAAVDGTYVDVLPAFARLTPAEKRATRFRFDQHYTPFAHRVVADALLPHLIALRQR